MLRADLHTHPQLVQPHIGIHVVFKREVREGTATEIEFET